MNKLVFNNLNINKFYFNNKNINKLYLGKNLIYNNDNILQQKLFRDIKVTITDIEQYNNSFNDSWTNFINDKVNNNIFTFYEAFEFTDYPSTEFIWFNDDRTVFIDLSIENYKLPENLSQIGDITFTRAAIYEINNNDFSNYQLFKTAGTGVTPIADYTPNLSLSKFSNDPFIITDIDGFQFVCQFIN